MKNQIKVGSKVCITNNGYTCSTYGDMFKKMNFKNKRINNGLENGTICTVFGIESPPQFPGKDDKVYGIRDGYGREALMKEKGLILIHQTQSNEDFDKLKAFCVEMELDITSEDIFKYLLRQK